MPSNSYGSVRKSFRNEHFLRKKRRIRMLFIKLHIFIKNHNRRFTYNIQIIYFKNPYLILQKFIKILSAIQKIASA
jgi:hypothetical protein